MDRRHGSRRVTDERQVPDRLVRSGESPVQLSDILAIAEWFRDDIAKAKAELMVEIAAAKADLRDFTSVHAQEHIIEGAERKAWQEQLAQLIETEKLAKARRDGILGALRFVFNLIGTNWRGILALAGTAAVLLGNVKVSVGP